MDDREERIQEAVAQVQSGNISQRKAAEEYSIPKSTLQNRLHGVQSRVDAHTHTQRLSPIQEHFLVEWILNEESAGRAPSFENCREFATLIARAGGDDKLLGNHWIEGFVNRNPRIRKKAGTHLEASRAKLTDEEKLEDFFHRLHHQISTKNIKSENIANFDETGVQEGEKKDGKVLGSTLSNQVYVAGNESTSWVTIGECITADGHRLTPIVIFKAKTLQGQWFPDEIKLWLYEATENGWITTPKVMKWLNMIYLPETKPVFDVWRLLVLDGHATHTGIDFMYTCWINKVQVLYLPSHSSHLTQPLDVAVFEPLKEYYSQKITKLDSYDHAAPIQKRRFLTAYYEASEQAFSSTNIYSGFSQSGICPFNPAKVLDNIDRFETEKSTHLCDEEDPVMEIPQRGAQVHDLAEQIGLDLSNRDVRAFLRAVGAGMDSKNQSIAALKHENLALETQVEAYKPKKRKRVHEDPNDIAANIVQIKKAKEEAYGEKDTTTAKL